LDGLHRLWPSSASPTRKIAPQCKHDLGTAANR
jgi:hypothetical protein